MIFSGYKNIRYILLIILIFLFICTPAWSYTINSGAFDVGSLDLIMASADLDNSGDTDVTNWVSAQLGFNVTLDWKAENPETNDNPSLPWTTVDDNSSIWALLLHGTPDYFLIKTGELKNNGGSNRHFLFENKINRSYAVIDMLTQFGISSDKPFDFTKISHVSEFTGAQVPEPTTMILFGFGLIGLAGIGRKKLV